MKRESAQKSAASFYNQYFAAGSFQALNFPISKTMRIAQQLYEGVDIKGQGTVGIITYLRTDSVRISEEADEAARAFISESYGENICLTEKEARRAMQRFRMRTKRSVRPILTVFRPRLKSR